MTFSVGRKSTKHILGLDFLKKYINNWIEQEEIVGLERCSVPWKKSVPVNETKYYDVILRYVTVPTIP